MRHCLRGDVFSRCDTKHRLVTDGRTDSIYSAVCTVCTEYSSRGKKSMWNIHLLFPPIFTVLYSFVELKSVNEWWTWPTAVWCILRLIMTRDCSSIHCVILFDCWTLFNSKHYAYVFYQMYKGWDCRVVDPKRMKFGDIAGWCGCEVIEGWVGLDN